MLCNTQEFTATHSFITYLQFNAINQKTKETMKTKAPLTHLFFFKTSNAKRPKPTANLWNMNHIPHLFSSDVVSRHNDTLLANRRCRMVRLQQHLFKLPRIELHQKYLHMFQLCHSFLILSNVNKQTQNHTQNPNNDEAKTYSIPSSGVVRVFD